MTDPAAAYPPLDQTLRAALRCPACRGALADMPAGLHCVGDCGAVYDSPAGGRPDLRLTRPIQRTVTRRLGTPPPRIEDDWLEALKPHPRPAVDFADQAVPRHLTAEMLSHFPHGDEQAGRATDDGDAWGGRGGQGLGLDLGCGRAIHRGVMEAAGWQYAGLDYREAGAPLLGDAHALPFGDAAFGFVLCVAVLEHVRDPRTVVQEAARVMRPGATLIGTVAFLEPWHDHSYFHHSHLAVIELLDDAGLVVRKATPSPGWPVLRAQAKALFPQLPRSVAETAMLPLQGLHRLGHWPLSKLGKRSERRRQLETAGAITFIADKPSPAPPSEPAPHGGPG